MVSYASDKCKDCGQYKVMILASFSDYFFKKIKSIEYVKDSSKANFKCAYCGSPFDTKEGLSKHIDRLHNESGILEGDVRHLME